MRNKREYTNNYAIKRETEDAGKMILEKFKENKVILRK